ncbi:MAG: hemerythrin domain-containing protein [Rhodocyclaceae bacterium]|nr:hemerythrin domain-containing protein [Rhodocyclaceae bacterium]
MRRHPDLVPLSREHHAPLRLGRHLLAGQGRDDLAQMLPSLSAHFRHEERTLLPVLEAHAEHALASRLRGEHETLASLLAAASRGECMAQAGRALIDHVRFEERVLFPCLEALFEETVP